MSRSRHISTETVRLANAKLMAGLHPQLTHAQRALLPDRQAIAAAGRRAMREQLGYTAANSAVQLHFERA